MKKFTAVLAALLILFTATLFAACDQKDNGASDRVSEEEWIDAFAAENADNATMELYMTQTVNGVSAGNASFLRKNAVKGGKKLSFIKSKDPDGTVYPEYFLETDGNYTYIYESNGENYLKYIRQGWGEIDIADMYRDYQNRYAEFTYDEALGAYTASVPIDLTTTYFVNVKIKNGCVSAVDMRYELKEGETVIQTNRANIKFYDYGKTDVTLPSSATYIGATEEEWEKAFDLENVTLRYLNTATDEQSGEVQLTTDFTYGICETDGANVCYGKGSTTMPSMPEPNRNENEFYIQEKDGKIYNYAKDGSGNWTVTENAAISVSYLKSVIGLVREEYKNMQFDAERGIYSLFSPITLDGPPYEDYETPPVLEEAELTFIGGNLTKIYYQLHGNGVISEVWMELYDHGKTEIALPDVG